MSKNKFIVDKTVRGSPEYDKLVFSKQQPKLQNKINNVKQPLGVQTTKPTNL